VKVGVLAVSEDWLSDAGLSQATTTDSKFAKWSHDIETAATLAKHLREIGAEVVLVLTHSLLVNTAELAEALRPDVDFVLGGHEHIAAPDNPEKAGWIISGIDFEQFSMISFSIGPDGSLPRVAVRRVLVPPDYPAAASPRVLRLRTLLAGYGADMQRRLVEPVGRVSFALDCRKFKLRTQETSGGCFFADALLDAVRGRGAEACFLIAGVISSHSEWPAGEWTMGRVIECFPWEGIVVVCRLRGAELLAALEHAVALLPRRFGRFPQVLTPGKEGIP
jgi:2',3'-cyclic-nucleotide 2'-phosphodiesterase (5'-nucleotidase family)